MQVYRKNGNTIDLLTSGEVAAIGNMIVPKRMENASCNDVTSTGVYLLGEGQVTDSPEATSNGILLVFATYMNGFAIQIYASYSGNAWIRTRWDRWYTWRKISNDS